MEHPSKRRRIERAVDRSDWNHVFQNGRRRSGSLTEKKEKGGFTIPRLELRSLEDQAYDKLLRSPRQKIQQLYDPLKSYENEPKRLLSRGNTPTQTNSNNAAAGNIPAQPAQPVSTVVNVAVSNGKEIVSNVVVPMASTPQAIPGFSDLTMAPIATPAPDSSPNKVESHPGDVQPPAAVAAAEAREKALQSQQAIAHELVAVSQAGFLSATPENRAVASQSPMAINGAGSSQQVLSPPSTPIPSTPQSSSSPSTSYFTSSPASALASTSPIAKSPTPSPGPTLSNSLMPSNINSTTSATVMSGSTASASTSLGSTDSQASAMSASSFAQASASQASASSLSLLAALTSASLSPSGFATSIQSGQSITGTNSPPFSAFQTVLSTSSSSQLSQSSTSIASASGSSASGVGGGGVVVSPSNTGSTSSPTSTPGAGSGGSSAPATPQLVGGIIGGIAGLAMILFLILVLFRWRRNRMGTRRNISPPIPQTIGPGGEPQTGTMTQRSSTAPIAAAGFFGRLRPVSSQTAATAATTDTAPSERGFQKISGRKITSVLASGGDGFGDNSATTGPSAPLPGPSSGSAAAVPGSFATPPPVVRPSPAHSLSGSSFYRDSHGFYGGVVPANEPSQTETSSSPSTSPMYPAPIAAVARGITDRGSPSRRPEEVANMRPGPARTPVINEPGQIPTRQTSRATPPGRPVRNTPPPIADFPRLPRDGVGRSHPSQDGSRGSRFREDTTPP